MIDTNSIKKTKILATLGPVSANKEILKPMMENGVDFIRVNASHIMDPEVIKSHIQLVRKTAKSLDKHVGVLLDLQGPKIRLGKFKNKKVFLKKDQSYVLTVGSFIGDDKKGSVGYPEFVNDVQIGETIYIDDGKVQLRIDKKTDKEVMCIVVKEGEISNHKGINLPLTNISMPALTEKDKHDTLLAIKNKFDYVALSFVSHPEDIYQLRTFLDENKGSHIKIIAKIERQVAIDNIIPIINASDAIMVARGDLGVEIGVENVPRAQKMIIREANKRIKPVIVATQMLESMINATTATRAEVSDVANAIYDRCDTVMLSGETAIGISPPTVVQTMSEICLASDHHLEELKKEDKPVKHKFVQPTTATSFCKAADQIAEENNATCIIAFTSSGNTPLIASKLNPSIPILSPTDSKETCQRIALYRGVTPILLPKKFNDISRWRDMIKLAVDEGKKLGFLKKGDVIIVIAGIPIGVPNGINSIRVVTV